MNLSVLQKLLIMSNEPDHINYITHGVRMYQTKGQDFSEDIASHFIRACLRVENPKAAAVECSKYKNRIGAWVTPKPLHLLIAKLVEINEIEAIVNMLDTVSKKGAISKLESFEILMPAIKSDESFQNLHPIALTAASKMLTKENYEKLSLDYPNPILTELEVVTEVK